jgi:hypothetical protein
LLIVNWTASRLQKCEKTFPEFYSHLIHFWLQRFWNGLEMGSSLQPQALNCAPEAGAVPGLTGAIRPALIVNY